MFLVLSTGLIVDALLAGLGVGRATEWNQTDSTNLVNMVRHERGGKERLGIRVTNFIMNFHHWLLDGVIDLITI